MRYLMLAVVFVLIGCQTPAEKVEAQKADIQAAVDTATKSAQQSQGEAVAIDKAAPPALKPQTAAHVKTTTATVKAVGAIQKPATALATTAATFAAKVDDGPPWLADLLRFLPVVILVGLGVAAYFFLPVALSFLKIPAVVVFGSLAGLYALYVVAKMIPTWVYACAGIAVGLGLVGEELHQGLSQPESGNRDRRSAECPGSGLSGPSSGHPRCGGGFRRS